MKSTLDRKLPLEHELKTSTIRNTLNPEWEHENFDFSATLDK
jgi:hypothetical protein